MDESEINNGNRSSEARKKISGLGLVLGALSGFLYATLSLFARLLTNDVNGVMIGWVRAMESLVIMLPFVIMKKGKGICGRSMKDFLLLILLAMLSAIIMALVITSLQLIRIADVLTVVALTPVFISVLNGFIFCNLCKWSEVLIMITCMTGAVLCIQPSFIFGLNVRHDWSYFEGFMLSTLGAIFWALVFIILGYLKDLELYVKVFWTNAGQVIPLTCYLLVTKSFEFPTTLTSYIYLFSAGISALIGLTLYVIGTYYDSPLMVSIGRTSDVPLSFIYDVIFFGDAFEVWAVVGAILILLSIIIPTIIKLYRNN